MRLVFFNSLFSQSLLSRKYDNFESDIATLSFVFADRRATARTTTFVEPCSIQIKKKKFWLQRPPPVGPLGVGR